MPALPRFFDYHFHPVGQGLFASGYLRSERGSAPDFQWVYDCGTTSKSKFVQAGLRDVKRLSSGRNRLDLLVLSHFDRDHISGVCDLIGEYSVGTLVLPYMPLWQRLVIGFEEGVRPDGKLMRFFVSPATYLARVPGANIERILYVMPSDEAPGTVPMPDGQPYGDESPKWEPKINHGTLDEADPASLAPQNLRVMVDYLKPRGAISIGGFWEFVPYNDASHSKLATKGFRDIIRGQQQRLLREAGEPERALKEIKSLYDRHFGGSSRRRNIISLFLYSGPIYSSWGGVTLGPSVQTGEDRSSAGKRYRHYTDQTQKGSVLYTGDGYLDTPERLNRLVAHLGKVRRDRIGAFQVMHHGAEGNWHVGVARAFSPAFSVFSSDPRHKQFRHPHIPVREEFQDFHPYQVDHEFGVTAVGALVPRAVITNNVTQNVRTPKPAPRGRTTRREERLTGTKALAGI